MLENDQEIILDSTNNVFVGPDGYFKIVIDEFDGQTVKAWHVEDAKGNKTRNLADRAKGKHVDVMINSSNRTVSHFIGRIATNLINELQAAIAELEK
ncbi:MAG: transcription factor [Bacillota bacterium]